MQAEKYSNPTMRVDDVLIFIDSMSEYFSNMCLAIARELEKMPECYPGDESRLLHLLPYEGIQSPKTERKIRYQGSHAAQMSQQQSRKDRRLRQVKSMLSAQKNRSLLIKSRR